MTSIESIYETQSDVLDLQRYLDSRNDVVFKRAQMRYEQRVNRFVKENVDRLEHEKRFIVETPI